MGLLFPFAHIEKDLEGISLSEKRKKTKVRNQGVYEDS